MTRTLSLASLLFACLLSTSAFASDPIGIYALIDRVVLEPSDSQPQRIQIHGAFCFAVRQFGDEYSPPVRGYLYYQLPPEKTEVARAEWADMKKIAGTGQIIAFGSRYQKFGALRRGAGPVAGRDANEKDVVALLTKLDDQNQSIRDTATDDLKRLGAAAEPKLRSALASTSTSAEAKNRIEIILANLQPDPYPLGFGLNRVRANHDEGNVSKLRFFPAAFSPTDGSLADVGPVKLIAANIAAADSRPKYFFEIENAAGEKESSGAVQQGDKQTEWSPKMSLKSGEKYTWRVWVDDGKNRGPVADAAFIAR